MRKHRGGSSCGAGSAWASVLGVVGDTNQQIQNTHPSSGNAVQPLHGSTYNAARYGPGPMMGGSRRRRKSASRRRTRKGGFWGQVISQAAVPFGLLGLQQTFGKRRHSRSSRKSRKHRR